MRLEGGFFVRDWRAHPALGSRAFRQKDDEIEWLVFGSVVRV
jgi:hypothetical protein